jgi:hypothetical protein
MLHYWFFNSGSVSGIKLNVKSNEIKKMHRTDLKKKIDMYTIPLVFYGRLSEFFSLNKTTPPPQKTVSLKVYERQRLTQYCSEITAVSRNPQL